MRLSIWVCLCLGFWSVQVCADITVTDDKGRQLILAQPARTIISLAPHTTEQLFELGAGGLIVGVGAYSDYPEAARSILRVGDYYTINLEQVISLKPDLILAWPDGPTTQQLQQLQQLGFPVYYSDPKNLQQIEDSLMVLAQLTDHMTEARERVKQYHSELTAYRQRYQDAAKIRVFYQVWHDPIYTISGSSFINEVIEICGGVNIFKELELPAPQIGIESVIAGQPQVIISQMGHQGAAQFPTYEQIPAVSHKALYTISSDDIGRPTVNIVNGIASMCQSIEAAREIYYPAAESVSE